MYVYLRAALRGNTGVEKEEALLSLSLLPLRPPTGSRPPVTCSPLILFSLTVPVVFLSLSLLPPHVRPLPGFVLSLFLYRSPFLSLRSLAPVSPRLSHSPCSSSLVPSFVTMHLVSPTAAVPICCCRYCCKLLMKPQGARASTCKRKGRGSAERKDEYLS